MKIDNDEKVIAENKIPQKIKKVIRIMQPDNYAVTSYKGSDNYRYYVYLKYNRKRFDSMMFFNRIKFEKTLEDICKKEKALFFIMDL